MSEKISNKNNEMEIIECKFCGKSNYKKYGFYNGKQKYECKECRKVFIIGDEREKYSYEKKLKVIKMYLEGMGIRSIERVEGVSAPLILKWIKGVAKVIKNKLMETKVPDNIKDIEILEADEITTYIKKNKIESGYGLLLIGTEIKLLILK